MEEKKMHSPNIVHDNIEKLASLFPHCVVETADTQGKITKSIDFDLLRQELCTSIVEGPQERYQLNWPGKREAIRKANAPISKTVRPCREESVDFDATQNIFVEGDNLDALKLLQQTHLGTIKMIYIDPPYNTRKDFVYKDNFTESMGAYLLRSGVTDTDEHAALVQKEIQGRFHSEWLSMMYARLKRARDLLRDDGVIFISIDDSEVYNLTFICNEIFGEACHLATFCWRRRKTQANLKKNVAPVHDFILAFGKTDQAVINRLPYDAEYIAKTFSNPDADPRGPYQTRPLAQPSTAPNPSFAITLPNGRIITAKWSCSVQTFEQYKRENRLYIPKKGHGMPRLKVFLSESEGRLPNTWLADIATTEQGTAENKELFGKVVFDFPKPIKLIQYLLQLGTSPKENHIVIDFFAGSATTAHAVLQLNHEDGGNRRFIAVQRPETCNKKSVAYKSGYSTIADISKERIRRAGAKLRKEHPHTTKHLDIGFRVLKIDS